MDAAGRTGQRRIHAAARSTGPDAAAARVVSTPLHRRQRSRQQPADPLSHRRRPRPPAGGEVPHPGGGRRPGRGRWAAGNRRLGAGPGLWAAARIFDECDGRSLSIPPLLAKEPPELAFSGEFRGSYSFEPAKLGLKAGDHVAYWAEAEDNKEPTANRSETGRRTIVVAAVGDGQQSAAGEPHRPRPGRAVSSGPAGRISGESQTTAVCRVGEIGTAGKAEIQRVASARGKLEGRRNESAATRRGTPPTSKATSRTSPRPTTASTTALPSRRF